MVTIQHSTRRQKGPMRIRELEDIPEANLLREQFPWPEIPRVLFDGVQVPVNLPEDIWMET